MAMIGNPIVSTDFPKDTFSGNGSTTAFTMQIAPASVNSVIVVVSGITQDPSTYTISGTTLTFSAAPPTGTSNISVRHLGVAGIPNTPSAGSVTSSSLAAGNYFSQWTTTGSDLSYTGGNVGINVSPYAWNSVFKATCFNNSYSIANLTSSGYTYHVSNAFYNSAGDWKYINSNGACYYGMNNGAFTWANASSGTAGNTVSFSQIFGVLANGPLVVGTATSQNQVGSISFSNTSGTASYGAAFYMNTGYNGTRNAISFGYNSSGVGAIVTGTSTTSYNTSSDYRLKDNIVPMTGALSTVALLKPVTYTWKLDGKDGQGFIAHELQSVVPDCVNGTKDAVDSEGKPVYQGVDTSFLVATLTAAIQEQQAMIEELKTRVTALENT